MRRSLIWFLLAIFWSVDALLTFLRHNPQQAALTALFAGCFLAAGVVLRKREQTSRRR